MKKRKRYLSLNFGPRRGVAMAGAFDGQRLEIEEVRRYPVDVVPMLDTLYWDFPAMFMNALAGIEAFTARHGADLDSLAVNSWGVDFGLLDKDGRLLANPVHFADARTQGVAHKFNALVPARRLYQTTGIRAERFGTLYQFYAMVLGRSPLLEEAKTMLMMADLTAYFLSGTAVQEYTLATTSGMYDAESRDWSCEIMNAAGLPPGLAPEIAAPGTVIGPLSDAIAEKRGLGTTMVIAAGSHDMAAAVAAVPAAGGAWMYVVAEDFMQVGVEVSEPILTDASYAAGFSNEGGVDGNYRLERPLMGLRVLCECVWAWGAMDGQRVGMAEALRLAEGVERFRRLINPDAIPPRAGAETPERINAMLADSGQARAETRGEFVRLCLDSAVLSLRHAVAQLMDITGEAYAAIHVMGWAAAYPELSRDIADATGMVVKAGPLDPKSVGNLVMQAIALGDIGSLEQGREIVSRSFAVSAHAPRACGEWRDAYRRFARLL